MTEAEWLTSTDSAAMLAALRSAGRGYVSYRKLRLFVVAYGRTDPNPLDPHRKWMDATERFADGEATGAELKREAAAVWQLADSGELLTRAEVAALMGTATNIVRGADELAGYWRRPSGLWLGDGLMADLLREIFGNPFRPVTVDPAWLAPTVVELAREIYAQRAYDRLPALADALRDAGCDHAELLAHCRSPGPHVRSCWALDLVLGLDRGPPARTRHGGEAPDDLTLSCVLESEDDGVLPTEAARRLRKVFPVVQLSYHLGGYRIGQRIRRLRVAGAPEGLLRREEERRTRVLQATVYDGEPPARVLDLTLHEGWVRAYHAAGTEDAVHRAAAALGYAIDWTDTDRFDLRDSPEERRHRARVRHTRDTVAARRAELDGAEALFATTASVYRVRLRDLTVTEPDLTGVVEPVPTRGLADLHGPFRFQWPWDEFGCDPFCWRRGPLITEAFHFGEVVELAVRHGASRPDSATPADRTEVFGAVREFRRAALAARAGEVFELVWDTTPVGTAADHRLDAFPRVRSGFRPADVPPGLRQALERRHRDATSDCEAEDEEHEPPVAQELYRGWWMRAPDGARLEVGGMPVVDFEAGTVEWWYSGQSRRPEGKP